MAHDAKLNQIEQRFNERPRGERAVGYETFERIESL